MRAAACALSLSSARAAHALEPLDTFLQASDERSFDAREAALAAEQRESEATMARTRLLPTVSATGRYLYNQYEISRIFPGPDNTSSTAIITPQHQRDLSIQATLPLIDVYSWQQIGASARSKDAADAQLGATRNTVHQAAVQRYYGVIAAEALARAAARSVEAADKNLGLVRTRVAAGVASELDAQRAEAEVERNRQILADATYQIALARRALETLSGRTPSPSAPELAAELDAERPLSEFLGPALSDLPQVQATRDEARAADKREKAARAVLLPTVNGVGTQVFTNAAGFGRTQYYSVGVTATWRLDASSVPALRAQGQAAEIARVRAERSRRDAEDAIYNAWHDVTRQLEKSRAARAQLGSAKLAARIARDRYAAGTATFLDVVLAERDELSAEAGRIEADANLCGARATLRLAAGKPLDNALCKEAP